MQQREGLSKARSVYTPTVTGHKTRREWAQKDGPRAGPGAFTGRNQMCPRAFALLVQVLGHDVAADVGGLNAPVGAVAEQHRDRDLRLLRRRVADEPRNTTDT